jgi:hypothetical protein
MTVKMPMFVFWVVTPCGRVDSLPAFLRNLLPQCLWLKAEAVYPSEMLISAHMFTRRYSPETNISKVTRSVNLGSNASAELP